ncbi:MAG: hypothetical protein AB1571_03490 [Nanoarchaeota archaeon]
MIIKDGYGVIISSVDFIKGEVKNLNGRSLGTIQRFNTEGLPFNFDARFEIKRDITGSIILKELLKRK